jgi:hypothetical protein
MNAGVTAALTIYGDWGKREETRTDGLGVNLRFFTILWVVGGSEETVRDLSKPGYLSAAGYFAVLH